MVSYKYNKGTGLFQSATLFMSRSDGPPTEDLWELTELGARCGQQQEVKWPGPWTHQSRSVVDGSLWVCGSGWAWCGVKGKGEFRTWHVGMRIEAVGLYVVLVDLLWGDTRGRVYVWSVQPSAGPWENLVWVCRADGTQEHGCWGHRLTWQDDSLCVHDLYGRVKIWHPTGPTLGWQLPVPL